MRRKLGIALVALSVLAGATMIVLANIKFGPTPVVRTGPHEFRFYDDIQFEPDWKLIAANVTLFGVGLLLMFIPQKDKHSRE